MKALVQRVAEARVEVGGEVVAEIAQGMLVYLGCEQGDRSLQAQRMAEKLARLRIFEDAEGKTNWDLKAVDGAILLVSQFTLAADLRRGNRPSFDRTLVADKARELLDEVAQILLNKGFAVKCGVFGAAMEVFSCNCGPATYWLETSALEKKR